MWARSLWYVYPFFKHVSFGVIGMKHYSLLKQHMRVEPVDEDAFPHIQIVSHPLIFSQPYFYMMQRFEKKIVRNLPRIHGLIGIDVADSDHITRYAVRLTKHATALIVPSNFSKRSYVSSGVKKPVHVIPHGCLTEDTLVLTFDGRQIPIGEMVERKLDAMLAGFDGERIVPTPILAYQKVPLMDYPVEIETETGKKLKLTRDHPVLTYVNGELRYIIADNLLEDFYLCSVDITCDNNEWKNNPKLDRRRDATLKGEISNNSQTRVNEVITEQKLERNNSKGSEDWIKTEDSRAIKYVDRRRKADFEKAVHQSSKRRITETFEKQEMEKNSMVCKSHGVKTREAPSRSSLLQYFNINREGMGLFSWDNRRRRKSRSGGKEPLTILHPKSGIHKFQRGIGIIHIPKVETQILLPSQRRAIERILYSLENNGSESVEDCGEITAIPNYKETASGFTDEILQVIEKPLSLRLILHEERRGNLHKDKAIKQEKIVKIRAIPISESPKYVYDVTTKTGNFIANGIIVHNCDREWIETPPQKSAVFSPLARLKETGNLKLILCYMLHSPHRKGLDLLLQFYNKLLKERSDILLVLKTVHRVRYSSKPIKNLKDMAEIPVDTKTLKGWLTEQQKMELYDLCDIYFLSSRGGAFEHPALEALARREIVLGAKGGAWEDYLPDWALIPSTKSSKVLKNNPIHNGYGVKLDVDRSVDKAVEILNNLDKYRAMVREHVNTHVEEKFLWENIGLQLRDVASKYMCRVRR